MCKCSSFAIFESRLLPSPSLPLLSLYLLNSHFVSLLPLWQLQASCSLLFVIVASASFPFRLKIVKYLTIWGLIFVSLSILLLPFPFPKCSSPSQTSVFMIFLCFCLCLCLSLSLPDLCPYLYLLI